MLQKDRGRSVPSQRLDSVPGGQGSLTPGQGRGRLFWGKSSVRGNDKLRLSIMAALSVTAAVPFFPLCRAHAADQPPANVGDAQAQTASQDQGASALAKGPATTLDTVVVTGSTSQRTLLNAS